MIKSIQKVIRIGTSAGVTIPAKEMKRQNIKFGDEVKITVEPASKVQGTDEKIIKEYALFTAQYGETLKNLADR